MWHEQLKIIHKTNLNQLHSAFNFNDMSSLSKVGGIHQSGNKRILSLDIANEHVVILNYLHIKFLFQIIINEILQKWMLHQCLIDRATLFLECLKIIAFTKHCLKDVYFFGKDEMEEFVNNKHWQYGTQRTITAQSKL